MAEVEAVVLAAGRAARFGAGADESKVAALLDGQPLVAHVVAAASASRVERTVVVTGQAAAATTAALAGCDVTLLHNPAFAQGMASSIVTALAGVSRRAEAVLVLLADMPRVRATTLDALIGAFEVERPDAVIPCHAGRRGNPVLLARSLFPALSRLRGDEGARAILSGGAYRIVELAVDDPGVLVDVDTLDALAALQRSADQAASRPTGEAGASTEPAIQPDSERRSSISPGDNGGANR